MKVIVDLVSGIEIASEPCDSGVATLTLPASPGFPGLTNGIWLLSLASKRLATMIAALAL